MLRFARWSLVLVLAGCPSITPQGSGTTTPPVGNVGNVTGSPPPARFARTDRSSVLGLTVEEAAMTRVNGVADYVRRHHAILR